MTVTFSTRGSIFCSKRPTDLTARFTKTAMETIAIAITMIPAALTERVVVSF